jgi:hypothetical protein
MDGEEGGPQKGFKVEDRRRFSESGEPRGGGAESEGTAEETEKEAAAHAARPDQGAAITFATFVLSLSTQALAHLGDIPNPIDRSTRVDLAAAREVIDIIGMLREKTRGNLDPDEAAQLDEALYALRMRYVDRVQNR